MNWLLIDNKKNVSNFRKMLFFMKKTNKILRILIFIRLLQNKCEKHHIFTLYEIKNIRFL